jgi:hypothetical protein
LQAILEFDDIVNRKTARTDSDKTALESRS